MKVLLLNGPPNSGKDTIADKLVDLMPDVVHQRFKTTLYLLTSILFRVPLEETKRLCSDRDLKDHPSREFGMRTPRQAMIYVSERVVKPHFSQDFFGRAAADLLVEGKLNVFSDSGFPREAFPLLEKAGQENFTVVRLSRPGCSFENDSRGYLPDAFCENIVDLCNDGSIEDIVNKVMETVSEPLQLQ